MPDILSRLEALHAAASPGPWTVDKSSYGDFVVRSANGEFLANVGDVFLTDQVMPDLDENNAELAAALRNALPKLLRLARAVDAFIAADYEARPGVWEAAYQEMVDARNALLADEAEEAGRG